MPIEEAKPRIKPRINTANTGVAPAIRKAKLQYPELTDTQIAKRVGCDPSNVHRVLARFLGSANTKADLADFQNSKADIYDALQHRFLMSISDADIAKAQLLPRVTASAILEDKARTVRGQATQVNVSVLIDLVQAAREMREKTAIG